MTSTTGTTAVAAGNLSAFNRLRLFIHQDVFVIEPLQPPVTNIFQLGGSGSGGNWSSDSSSSSGSSSPMFTALPGGATTNLVFSRDTATVRCGVSMTALSMSPPQQVHDIYALLGTIRLLSGEYLLVAEECELVGTLTLPLPQKMDKKKGKGKQPQPQPQPPTQQTHEVWRITKTRLHAFARSTPHLSAAQIKDEAQYLRLIQRHLNSPSMYYSPTLDLTQSLQRQAELFTSAATSSTNTTSAGSSSNSSGGGIPLWRSADQRFFWNRHILRRLIDYASSSTLPSVHRFIVPVVYGHIAIDSLAVVGDHQFTYAVISRRSQFRAGTRYFARGVDDEGNVANFVETEQIVIIDQPPHLQQQHQAQGVGSQSTGSTDSAVNVMGVSTSVSSQSGGGGYGGGVGNSVGFSGDSALPFTQGGGTLHAFSHVQIRGSVPLHWAQVIRPLGVPTVIVPAVDQDNMIPFKRHIDSLISIYGSSSNHGSKMQSVDGDESVSAESAAVTPPAKVIAVNLVKKTKSEGKLAEAFAQSVSELNDERLRYIHFDFNTECSNLRWDRIQLVFNDIRAELESQSFFHIANKIAPSKHSSSASSNSNIISYQTSVVRTNCMDCLDRTNIVQTALARHVLSRILRSIKVIGPDATVTDFEAFDYHFRHMWADSGDAISAQYAGTTTLRNDYMRAGGTGERAKWGALRDMAKSTARFLQQNWKDGKKQDGIDLFLGNFTIDSLIAASATTNDGSLATGGDVIGLSTSTSASSKIMNSNSGGSSGSSGGGIPIMSPYGARNAGKLFKVPLPVSLEVLVICFIFVLCTGLFTTSIFTSALFTIAGIVKAVIWLVLALLTRWYIQSQLSGDVLQWPALVPYPYQPTIMRRKGTITPMALIRGKPKSSSVLAAARKSQ
ncbi:hypothetical protein GQ42DRAFT_160640 [Ramicandelaber brevisporus]|nr:hypothetical protein GQ42DRAFT_160640 [Ramicandelaber brevisporus]